MTLKRTLELAAEDDDHSLTNDDKEPPLKRRQFSVPHTPLPKSSGSSSYPSSARTPFTPYPSRPSDSPSNPFGRKRLLTLTHTLPPTTSFSEHLALRFQLSRSGISPRLGGVYRIVQVPLSYTFVHLRCLILYLFGGGYVTDKQDRHLFQVKKNIVIYNQTYKPCQVKTGVTVVKLSSACDPGRYRPKSDEDALLGDTNDDASNDERASEAESNESAEEEDWFWAAEEDFTLGHAWPRGGDLTRGIIYQHTPTTIVHITINTAPLPKRKGRSNIPYVFSARGRVRLLPSTPFPLPRPLFSVPTHKLLSPASPRRKTRSSTATRNGSCVTKQILNAKLTDTDVKNDNDTRPDHEDEPDDEEKDDYAAIPNTDKWNTYRGFSKYIKLAHEHGRLSATLYEEDEDEDEYEYEAANEMHHFNSTPGLTDSHASSPTSSSSDLPSPLTLYPSSESISFAQPHGLPILPFGCTPAPQHAQWQRLQIERVSKRMERLKKGEWICARDEDLDEEDPVDELAGDDDDKPFVKPVLKPGEVWDPFGDEYEI